MKLKTKIIIIGITLLLLLILVVPLISSISVGTSEMTEGKVIYTPPVAINYSLIPTVNSSDYWDALDSPLATWLLTYNETYHTWAYNQTTSTYNLYGKWWYNQSLATYDMWNTAWLSTYNATYDAKPDVDRFYNWTDGAGATDNLTTTGDVKSNRFALYEPIEDNTNYIIPYSQPFFDDKTLTLWYTGNYRLGIHGDTQLNQDLHTSATPTWPSINIDSLEMGDDTPTEGNWILDMTGKDQIEALGYDGIDGEGMFFRGGKGGDSTETGGSGGGPVFVLGKKGEGIYGGSDGIDGIFNITGLPLEPSTATAMYICWDTDGHVFLNETKCRT